MTKNYPAAKAGIFGIGLAAYWDQFPGLKERLEGYQQHVEDRIGRWARVVSVGLVDTAPRAQAAGAYFAQEAVDLIFCYAATYATSSQVLPVVQEVKVPVVVLNLQPVAALDYENTDTGEWLANCSACCVPEISNAFDRSGIPFNVVSGMLFEEEGAWKDIREWCEAAKAVVALRGSRFGFLGHTYPGMLDMYSDFTMHHAQFGLHVEILEMDDLKERVDNVTEGAVAAKVEEARSVFEIDESVDEGELEWAAQVAVGLDALASDFDLNALAYYYRGSGGSVYERLGAGLILGNSLLTARGIPASGEGDLKNAVAMKIMDALGAGGSFTEFYAMDFEENFLLMGHDGPGHVAISDRKPVLRGLGLYHGKAGYGVSVEFSVRTGPVTIFAVTQTRDGHLKLLAAEGESIPGPTLKIGNTNSRIRFSLPPAEFMNAWCEQGPTHHCALGVGHHAGTLRKVARLLELEFVEVASRKGG
ncbi:L-fucose/L-arabinose isomerase family protein [Rubrobacter naiadicus]|uniref:L-fucose/L-arabinose isomerase family protein n=1 Tax=Rubrobacter naiadicus TaxID=1392641 RepID=UPI00236125C8|nr:L-fucose/L-arabinose isomerase family protein [Rubrobacter naiadicus]